MTWSRDSRGRWPGPPGTVAPSQYHYSTGCCSGPSIVDPAYVAQKYKDAKDSEEQTGNGPRKSVAKITAPTRRTRPALPAPPEPPQEGSPLLQLM